jgi:hypothetical protein
MTDDAESAIAPRARQPVPAPVVAGDGTTLTPLEIWPYLVMGALLLLVLEWWRFGRRG